MAANKNILLKYQYHKTQHYLLKAYYLLKICFHLMLPQTQQVNIINIIHFIVRETDSRILNVLNSTLWLSLDGNPGPRDSKESILSKTN